MAKLYTINPQYGVLLADSGEVIPVSPDGPLDIEDRDELLKLILAAAVEVDFAYDQLKSASGTLKTALSGLHGLIV